MGKVIIIAQNIVERTSGSIREDAGGNIINHAGGRLIQTAEKGIKYGKYQKPKPPTDVRVTKLEGPFENIDGKPVDKIKLRTPYLYKASLTRKPSPIEEGFLRWAVQLDEDEKVLMNNTSSNQKVEEDKVWLVITINKEFEKARVYAYYKSPKKEGSVEVSLEKPCYCSRDFTVEEVRMIVKKIRDNTFYYDEKAQKKYSITHYHGDKLFYLQANLSKEDKTYERLTFILNTMFNKYNINTCIRKIHFLSQMYWETTYFADLRENGKNLDYDPYRGRGFMQLTNKDAYIEYEKYSGKKVFNFPDLISNSLELSADTGGWFWTIFKKANYTEPVNKEKYKEILGMNLAEISDFGDKYLGIISKLVNGGSNGKRERIDAYNALKKLFNYEKSCVNHKTD